MGHFKKFRTLKFYVFVLVGVLFCCLFHVKPKQS